MELYQKIVEFGKYCKDCKYKDLKENEEPCDHCLEEPVNTYSHKPVNFIFQEGEKHERES